MKIGDPVAVIWTGFLGDGTALMHTRVDGVTSDSFTVTLSDGLAEAVVHCLFSTEGTAWCYDNLVAVAALLAAYALR